MNDTSTRTCLKCGKKGEGYPKCGRCKSIQASYCCKQCQIEHWPSHRLECQLISEEKTESPASNSSGMLEIGTNRLTSDRSLKKRREAIKNEFHLPSSTTPTSALSSTDFPSSGFHFSPTVTTKEKPTKTSLSSSEKTPSPQPQTSFSFAPPLEQSPVTSPTKETFNFFTEPSSSFTFGSSN